MAFFSHFFNYNNFLSKIFSKNNSGYKCDAKKGICYIHYVGNKSGKTFIDKWGYRRFSDSEKSEKIHEENHQDSQHMRKCDMIYGDNEL
jgi:hypothetical protein